MSFFDGKNEHKERERRERHLKLRHCSLCGHDTWETRYRFVTADMKSYCKTCAPLIDRNKSHYVSEWVSEVAERDGAFEPYQFQSLADLRG